MVDRFVGLDLGTTGVRAVVFDQEAQVLGEADREYPLHTPRPGWAEQDPAEVSAAALECLRLAALEANVGTAPVAIGISGTFHNVFPLDARDRPLARAVIWADTRAAEEVAQIKTDHDVHALYRRTGCPAHPMYLPPKLRWLAKHVEGAVAFRSIKEQVTRDLTGTWACELSLASGTGMLDMRRRDWDQEALAIAGVDRGQLGPLVETTDVVGRLTADVSRATGLARESVVVAGAGDGVLSSLGAGAIAPGQMTATVGTSGAVRLVTHEPRVDDRQRTWCYYLAQGRWVAGGAINNAGIAFRWAAEKLLRAGPREYEQVADWAGEAPAGAGGLLFLPFLTGERAPYWNADARGVLVGLAIDHDHRHVARATLEGVCFRMRSIYDALVEVAGPVREVRATGGFTRTPLWLQMLSDVLEQPLRVPVVQEASALGAAELAMIGVGALPDLDATARFARIASDVKPDQGLAATYARSFDLYMKIYWDLSSRFAEIAALQRA